MPPISRVMLFAWTCTIGIAQENESASFVDYPEPIVTYLQRIQEGEQSHAFKASLDFATWQRDARRALEDLVGLTRMHRDLSQFEPTITLGDPVIVDDAFSRTQGAIETEPGITIPFYLLVPVDAKGTKTNPLMLCHHGHDTKGWHSYAGAYLDDDHRNEIVNREGNIAEEAARRGFIAIAPATRGLAAEVNVPDPKGRHGKRPCRAQLIHCLVAGRTPLGERLWDMQRLLDWACKLPQVDPQRILMTGNSGGGVLTAYTAAIDTRVTVAIPSCSFTSLTSQEGFLFHCDCCLVPGLRDWGDWKEIGGLIAPRHLLIVHGRKDGLHHHNTVERTAQSVATIYSQIGFPNRMRLQWGEEGHRFYPQVHVAVCEGCVLPKGRRPVVTTTHSASHRTSSMPSSRMPLISRALLLITLLTMVPHAALAQAASEWVKAYEPKVHDDLPYRLMSPLGFDETKRYPVIVSLHGGGGKGTDNRKQLKQWNQQLAEEQIRKDYPCYVLAPQSTGLWDETHLKKIQAIIDELPAIDRDRIYMMGHSMGGHGSNILIQLAAKYFAAIAPSAGTGLKRTEEFIDPSKMKDVPIWAFHGDQDKVCPYDRNLELFHELKELGGNMKLTTFKGDGHGIAGKMIPGADNGSTLMSGERCDPEPDFLKWLFAQRLPGNQAASEEEKTEVPSTFLTFNHNEVERRYLIHLPKDLPDNAPLVFLLHGYRGDARGYMELGLNRVADANGFAVCYPQGEKDRKGIPHWNARFTISKVDDIGFLSALAVHLQAEHKLDPNKTFTCGISNGGFMSYTLVAEKPDVFKAAASIIGTMSGYTWEHRDQIKPVSVLQISGLNDEIIPYDGSMSPKGGWGGAPNQDIIMDFWKELNQTKTTEEVKLSDKTTAHYYKDGVHGHQVWHYKIKEFGHRFPHRRNGAGISSVQEIWKFFKQF